MVPSQDTHHSADFSLENEDVMKGGKTATVTPKNILISSYEK